MHSVLAADCAPTSIATPRPRVAAALLVFILGWLWFCLCRQLSYEWLANEQYSYGWFVPFFALYLSWLRLQDVPVAAVYDRLHDPSVIRGSTVLHRRYSLRFSLSAFCFLLFLLLPLRLFEVANPDWRPLSWLHALTVVGLTLLVLYSLGGKAVMRHFAFPVCFILVAVPWISPIEAPLVQGLMRLVAAAAAETLTLLGIPAQLQGSVIHVSNGLVGVSEACSGVRSLQTSLMIGLLFGELKRLSVTRRFVLVIAAIALALLANFGRALFLVWIAATRNLVAVERWHDLAGYAVVGAVFIGTVGLAGALAKAENGKRKAETELGGETTLPASDLRSLTSALRLPPLPFLLSAFCFLLFVEAAVSGWYRWHERNFVATAHWTVSWPEHSPGFREIAIADNVASTLRYDDGREVTWPLSLTSKPNEQKIPARVAMFFFRWNPSSASILRARAHRPDICLPNTGWRMTADNGVRRYPVAPDFSLPFRHFTFVHNAAPGRQLFANALFCEREDRVPPKVADRFDATAGRTGNWLRSDRLRVVRQGLRNQGQQVLEFVLLTPREISKNLAEDEFAQLVRQSVRLKH